MVMAVLTADVVHLFLIRRIGTTNGGIPLLNGQGGGSQTRAPDQAWDPLGSPRLLIQLHNGTLFRPVSEASG
jgi:hypothetical protein